MDLNATFKRVQQLSASLVGLSDETINLILIETADAAVAQSKFIWMLMHLIWH
jgi:glutamate-5-semialdehyde dehydrogenase (EC 1.2.1.41)